ncbi:hypothetical protein D5039_21715 [Verminephrobacter aporrectodeae subsp. tuberculatae]|uniref:Uncharacterized protein n=2 Tax=Verminephrobacter TaxID=364316 RepID=A0ABT3KZ97_9BURK|nr:hypothetical protein [Verminephrobacter aporrectodeae subsp. tuberculatae]
MLFSGRRWMLWLPLPAAAVLAASGGNFLASCIPVLVGGLIFWIPFWLAWWLSDGFKGMSEWHGIGAPDITAGVHPCTGKPCFVHHLPWGDYYS